MRTIIATTQFRRDMKNVVKRGYDMQKLQRILSLLIEDKPLPVRCRDHALIGAWSDHRDCHIAPDWLLIYSTNETDVVLVRTGTHSDIFRK